MDDLFAPPGNAWQPVSPQLGRMRRLVLAVLVALALIATVSASWLFHLPAWFAITLSVVLLALLALGWLAIGRNARSWGYAERDEDLYVKHGALFRELVAVPYGRMQYVDITSGPVEQLFGISSVHLHTASPKTSARIPGLPKDEAARLRDRLTSLGEAQAAGL
ncbi:MAG TPA: PH domain-containing protein [Nocardioidaceae bacterium]|nr:PH domain-containing protein [Nocardioidaceae bacterium]